MKTIINKSGFAWCILLALAFTGCQGDQEGKHHFDNKVFISAASYTPEVCVMRDALDVTEEQTCEITVAQADPFIPHPNPKINNGFKAQLITTDANVAYIAIFGNPEERKTAFNPRYICVTTLPYRIIRI